MLKNPWNKYKNLPVQVRATFWFLICAFLQKGISVITTPIFTRLLTTSEYGQFSVFNSWMGIVNIFVSLNLYAGVYGQGLIKFSEDRKSYASSLQGLTLTLTLGWTGIYLLFHEFWNRVFSLTTVQMLAMLVLIWTSAVFQFWAAEQRVEYKYRTLVIVTMAVSIAKPVIGILFVTHANDKVTARILGLALVELIGYTGFFFLQMKRGKAFFLKTYWVHALRFSLPLVPHYLSQTVLVNADRIMINVLVSADAAGIYSLAYAIAQLMLLFNTALMQTMSPWIYQKIKEKKAEEISSNAYRALILVAVVNLLLIAFAPEAVMIFAPGTYYNAVWVIPPIAMSVLFQFSYDLFAKFEFYYEKTTWIMAASVMGAGLNVALNYICIPKWGYYAAGYTTLLCYIIYAMAHYFFMRRICIRYLDGAVVYKPGILLAIYITFLMGGFLLMATYQFRMI